MFSVSQQCWICHQDCASQDNVLNQKNLSPCFCKGSLESVHRECLNKWVTKRYKKILNEFNALEIQIDEITTTHPLIEKLTFHCPNCKYPLKYEVIELPTNYFSLRDIFSHNYKEKIILMILIAIQLGLLLLDYFRNDQSASSDKTASNDQTDFLNAIQFTTTSCDSSNDSMVLHCIDDNNSNENNEQSYNIMNILYLITVFIVLMAAGYNIFFDQRVNYGVEVKDKDYLDNLTLNLKQ